MLRVNTTASCRNASTLPTQRLNHLKGLLHDELTNEELIAIGEELLAANQCGMYVGPFEYYIEGLKTGKINAEQVQNMFLSYIERILQSGGKRTRRTRRTRRTQRAKHTRRSKKSRRV